jgi:predicted nucleic acid-binding OB-fold protein
MSLNDSIKQLEQLAKGIGSMEKLIKNVQVQAVESSNLSPEEKNKMSHILKSINFDELAKRNVSEEELREIIKNKI